MNSQVLHSAAPFQVAGCRVEPATLRVIRADGEIRLESKAMQVLVYLVERIGEVVTRNELEEHLWPGRFVTDDAVTSAVGKLRRAFGDDARQPQVIETVPKIGYRFIAPVTPVTDAGAAGSIKIEAAGDRRKPVLLWTTASLVVALLVALAWNVLHRDQEPSVRPVIVPGKPAVAVFPFENLGASPEQDYLANGVTADLITDLSKIQRLLVIAPGSVFDVQDDSSRQTSNALGVDYVLRGSVQRSGNRLRVNVQLFEASAERAIWGERYDGLMENVFAVQDTLSSAVIDALKVEIGPGERAALAKRPTQSVAAYDLFLRGLSAHGHRSSDENLTAKELFQRAIELDPDFARAYAGLAMAHSRDAIDGWTSEPLRSLDLAKELVNKAARLDASLPQVHFVRGQVELFQRHHMAALEAVQRAIQIDPNYADAHALSAWILSYAGRPDHARAAMEHALRLNPSPSASYLEVLGEIEFVERRYMESVTTFQRVLDINPEYMRARLWLVAALAYKGPQDMAEWEAVQLQILHPGFSVSQLGFAFPFKDPRELEHLENGLRKAGLTN